MSPDGTCDQQPACLPSSHGAGPTWLPEAKELLHGLVRPRGAAGKPRSSLRPASSQGAHTQALHTRGQCLPGRGGAAQEGAGLLSLVVVLPLRVGTSLPEHPSPQTHAEAQVFQAPLVGIMHSLPHPEGTRWLQPHQRHLPHHPKPQTCRTHPPATPRRPRKWQRTRSPRSEAPTPAEQGGTEGHSRPRSSQPVERRPSSLGTPGPDSLPVSPGRPSLSPSYTSAWALLPPV